MLEHMIKKALRTRTGNPPGACPEDEVLAAYVDRILSGSELRSVEDHLVTCDTCLDQVVLCSGELDVPEAAVDVVVRFLDRTMEVLRGVGTIQLLPEPSLVAIRGTGEEPETLKCVRFGRHFPDLEVEVEVEQASDGLGEIRVQPSSSGTLAEDVRVTLMDDQRELDSRLARGGSVSFVAVAFGNYVIRFSRQGRSVGEVSLRLETG